MQRKTKNEALQQFRKQGGILRTTDALQLGIQPRTLYALRDQGDLLCLERGLYRLAALPPLQYPALVSVAMRIPRAVVCLASALAFHQLIPEVSSELQIALPKQMQKPRMAQTAIRPFWFSDRPYQHGIQTYSVDGVAVQVYSPAKSVADCFKFRNKLGVDVAIAGLKSYLARSGNLDTLSEAARVNRVQTIMRPYIEGLVLH